MPKNKPNTDAAWVDLDDAPAWTPEVFDRAEVRRGEEVVKAATGTLTRRGRPPLERPKKQVSLRLDQDVIDRFRADGPGWQSRINDALRKTLAV